MTPEEALAFIDSSADGGLGAPDYGEAYSIVKESLARVAELEAENKRLQDERDALYRDCPGV